MLKSVVVCLQICSFQPYYHLILYYYKNLCACDEENTSLNSSFLPVSEFILFFSSLTLCLIYAYILNSISLYMLKKVMVIKRFWLCLFEEFISSNQSPWRLFDFEVLMCFKWGKHLFPSSYSYSYDISKLCQIWSKITITVIKICSFTYPRSATYFHCPIMV